MYTHYGYVSTRESTGYLMKHFSSPVVHHLHNVGGHSGIHTLRAYPLPHLGGELGQCGGQEPEQLSISPLSGRREL